MACPLLSLSISDLFRVLASECSRNRQTDDGITHDPIMKTMLHDLFSQYTPSTGPLHLPSPSPERPLLLVLFELRVLKAQARFGLPGAVDGMPEHDI